MTENDDELETGDPMRPERPHAKGSPARCSARTRDGGICQNAPVSGRTRCRMHGGGSPVGFASPSFKHGRYSSVLPNGLRETYERSLSDPDLLALDSELALLDARLGQLLGSISGTPAASRWKEVSAGFRDLQRAINGRDGEAISVAISRLDAAINSGVGDQGAWSEVFDLCEQRRRLAATEHSRRVSLGDLIPSNQVFTLLRAFAGLVQAHVSDQVVLAKIGQGLRALVSRSSSGGVNDSHL